MPYPVILNGDHAEFEVEHANTPANERPDWPLPSFDARDWAAEFCRIAKTHGQEIDESWMVAWFANALMRGYDQGKSEGRGGWRLIEGAPDDGKDMLLCYPDGAVKIASQKRGKRSSDVGYKGPEGWLFPTNDRHQFPTHWQPLPKAADQPANIQKVSR